MPIQFRDLKQSDAQSFLDATNDENVFFYLRGFFCTTLKQAELKIEAILSVSDMSTYVIEENNCFIGCIFAMHTNLNEVDISYFISPQYRNNGYATQALKLLIDQYKGYTLYFYIEHSNYASKRLIQKFNPSQKIKDSNIFYVLA